MPVPIEIASVKCSGRHRLTTAEDRFVLNRQRASNEVDRCGQILFEPHRKGSAHQVARSRHFWKDTQYFERRRGQLYAVRIIHLIGFECLGCWPSVVMRDELSERGDIKRSHFAV